MQESEALSPGQALGRYELLAQVARGGMGEVWAARLKGARGFQKVVAIKTLLPELRSETRIEEMLLEEARIASLIHHPNVVQTTELGEHGQFLYLVMEWVDGESLSFLMKRAEERGWVPIPIGVNLIAQACRGLHAAHELTSDLGVHLGVVHRDVSPHNVLVTHTGVVKLVDFGIAKATNEQGSLTANGELKGKYSFMAPEQVTSSGDIDRRADVFALGITLYMLVTGRHPFKTNTKQSVLGAITSSDPATPPRKFVPGCSAALEAVVLKALEKDPDKRYQTTEAMRIALESALPEAFAPRFEQQVREYLSRTMGDRAAARREALRRFQLSADERLLSQVDTGAQLQIPSQSAGSLRAIIVEGTQPGAREISDVQRISNAETEIGQRRRGKRLGVTLAATAALAALAAVLILRGGAMTAGPAPAAAPTPMATLDAPPVPPAPQPAPPPVAPPAAVTVAAPPVETPAPPPSARAAAPAVKVPLRAAITPKKKPNKADAADLIAPDFAK